MAYYAGTKTSLVNTIDVPLLTVRRLFKFKLTWEKLQFWTAYTLIVVPGMDRIRIFPYWSAALLGNAKIYLLETGVKDI